MNPERPQPDEYDSFYAGYVGKVDEGALLETLARQADEAAALCAGLDDERGLYRYAESKWSIKEVIGHLIDAERIFGVRVMVIARGETQPLFGFDQDQYIATGRFDERSVANLAREWSGLRQANLALFEGLGAEEWARRGEASGYAVSARAVGYILAGHERHHLDVLRTRYAGA